MGELSEPAIDWSVLDVAHGELGSSLEDSEPQRVVSLELSNAISSSSSVSLDVDLILELLPTHLIAHVLHFLTPLDLTRLARTSKFLRDEITRDLVWEKKCKSEYSAATCHLKPPDVPWKTWYKERKVRLKTQFSAEQVNLWNLNRKNQQSGQLNTFARATSDYQQVQRVIVQLKRLREEVVDDIETLKKRKAEALENPADFVEQLVNQNLPRLPSLHYVPNLPRINWRRYSDRKMHYSQIPAKGEYFEGHPNYVSNEGSERTAVSRSSSQANLAAALPLDRSAPDVAIKEEPGLEKPQQATVTPIPPEIPIPLQSPKMNGDIFSGVPPSPQPKAAAENGNHDDDQKKKSKKGESEGPEDLLRLPMVRGRIVTADKPPLFNALWDEAEQKRLEDLLLVYPDEEPCIARWRKIAQALGNGRTPRQVASRVQKYFIRLVKAGKPVPGRMPNMEYYQDKPKRKKKEKDPNATSKPRKSRKRDEKTGEPAPTKRKTNKERIADPTYYRPPAVVMGDDEEDEVKKEIQKLDPALKDTAEYKELVMLLRIQKQQEKQNKERIIVKKEDLLIHEGFKCDSCGIEPIVGERWVCSECPKGSEVDLCKECKQGNTLENQAHKKSHLNYRLILEPEKVPYYLEYEHAEGENYLGTKYTGK